jgi:hypothetical protein
MNSQTPLNVEGQMIFFVQPNSVIRTELIAELIKQEYEVYLIPDAVNAKRVFYQYPHCLAFLNIDDGFSEDEWLRFVQEVQKDPLLKQVKIGILTYNPDKRLAEKYLINRTVPCGFVRLSLKTTESIGIIAKVLEANEAKGRRKYLRVHCDKNSRLSFKDAANLIEGRVLDLSSVGMTCLLNPDKQWAQRSVFESIRLKLEGGFCTVSGIVMGSRRLETGEGTLYLILFNTKTPNVSFEKIRAYMQRVLQSSIDTFLMENRLKAPNVQQHLSL